MASNSFTGNGQDEPDVWTVTPGGVIEIDDQFFLAIGSARVSYLAGTLTGDATVADVVAGLVAAWNDATFSEFSGITAAADASGDFLTITGQDGIPFKVTASTSTSTAATITVSQTTVGRFPENEVQRIKLQAGVSGGSFTYSNDFGGGTETTGAINWNASAADVLAAIIALATPVSGDLAVVKVADGEWLLYWQGAFAAVEVPEGTIDGSSLTGTGAVDVEEVEPGRGLSDEIQTITIAGLSSSWSTRIGFAGALTSVGGITQATTAAQLQAQLEALSTIGTGNIKVYGGSAISSFAGGARLFFVKFTGGLGGTNVAQLVHSGDSNCNASISTVVAGGAATADEFQVINLGVPTSGTFKLSDATSETAALAYNITKEDLEIAIEGLDSFDDVEVSGSGGLFGVLFVGSSADTAVDLLGIDYGSLSTPTAPTISEVRRGQASVNQQWNVRVYGSGGSFTLTDGTDVTSAITFGAAAATIVTRLQTDITAFTTVTVTGTGTPDDPYVVTITAPAATPFTLTGDGSLLTGGDGLVTEVTAHDAGQSAVFTITVDASVTGGTWDAGWKDKSVTGLAYNIATATLQTQLETLFGSGNVAVAGTAGASYTATMQGTLAKSEVDDMTVDGSNLIGGDDTQTLTAIRTTLGGGKNRGNDANNWSGGRVLESGDDLVFEQCDRDLLWNLDFVRTVESVDTGTDRLTLTAHDFVDEQAVKLKTTSALPSPLATGMVYYVRYVDANTIELSATRGGSAIDITTTGTGTHRVGVEVANYRRYASFTGLIGLAKYRETNYLEYLPRKLNVWIADGGDFLEGEGEGSGSGRTNVDLDDSQVVGRVIQTGGSIESGVPALQLVNSNAASIWKLIDGETSFAFAEEEVSQWQEILLMGGNLTLGKGQTIGSIEKRGGTIVALGGSMTGTLRGIL